MFNINAPKSTKKDYPSSRGVNFGALLPLHFENIAFGQYQRVKAQGKLTVAVQPTDGDTFTIGSRTYTLQTTLTNANGNIKIGVTLADTQKNIVDAINLTGTPATQYAGATRVNTQVTIGNFSGNEAIITSKETGTAGNSIATTETFASGSNIFDSATLGTYRAGADFSTPDASLRPHNQMYMEASGDAGTGERVNVPNNEYYNDYLQFASPALNYKWLSQSFYKIYLPNAVGVKYKRLQSIGMCLATQIKKELSSTIGASTNTNIYKIIEVDTNKGVALFYNGTDSKLYVIAFTINDTTGEITAGTAVTVNNTNCTETESDIVKIDTDKVLIGYKDSLATNFPKTAVATISGTTVTVATGVQPVATATTAVRMCQLTTNKALLVFNNTELYGVSIAVTTPSYGGVTSLAGLTGTIVTQNGTDKFQLAYTKSSLTYTNAGTVATLAITMGTEVQVTSGNPVAGSQYRHRLIQVDTDKIVYITDESDQLQDTNANAFFLTISGTATTIASSTYYGLSEDSDVDAVLLSATKIMVVRSYSRVGYINVDTTNNLLTVDTHTLGANGGNYFNNTDNNRNYYTYNGQGNVRIGKIGNYVVTINRQVTGKNKLEYNTFPVSINIDVYLNDDFVKTVTFSSPASYERFMVNLDINDYEAHIKLKNPRSQLLYLFPEARAVKSVVILD